MTVVIAIIIFGVIIALHEFGHFFTAKLFNIKVLEFSVGMGPAIFKKQRGETLYSLRLLPIGGFCAFDGEDSESDDERSFSNTAPWKQIIVLVAGAAMNIILGFILVVIVTAMNGNRPDENGVRPEDYIVSTTVGQFYENAKSEQTGLRVDDTIVEVNGVRVYVDGDVSYQFARDEDGVFSMKVIRNGVEVELENVAFDMIKNEDGTQRIVIDFMVRPIKKTFATVLEYSFKKSAYISRVVLMSLYDVIIGKYPVNQLSGPVGVVSVIGSVIVPEADFVQNLITILNVAAFITINIGIVNILPLPSLDGGRIVFRVIELVSRKKIPLSIESKIHFVGLALLMILMVFATYNDIVNFILK